jgi:Fe-S-cluster-containing dehydrogenase component
MSQYAIITDLDRCVGCLACSVACKAINNVPIGSFWSKILRVGPNPKEGGSGQYPDVEMYFLNVQCQHCENPECVSVCPTSASRKLDDGTVQIDKSKCIGCQFCVMACPYNVRYLNEDERVVEKCTLCEQKIAQGELPQCVSQCCGMARWFGKVEEGVESFKGSRGQVLGDYIAAFNESQVHKLPDVGNKPSLMYILRDMKWKGGK